MKIQSTKWGIAYRVGDTIQINPVLKEYPKLYSRILEHERQHTSDNDVNFLHDLKSIFYFDIESLKFFIEHPIISLQSICPLWVENGKLQYNGFLCMIYLLLFAMLLLGVGIYI